MDLNLVVIFGRLAAPPELRVYESGTRLIRYLITVRADQPRSRVDVLPITLWNPPAEVVAPNPDVGERVSVTGTVQRRFWSNEDERRSRLEVIADHVTIGPFELEPDGCA